MLGLVHAGSKWIMELLAQAQADSRSSPINATLPDSDDLLPESALGTRVEGGGGSGLFGYMYLRGISNLEQADKLEHP
jgi:hypothetical protein